MAAHISSHGMTAHWRAKIKTALLLNRLSDHAAGKCDMTRSQVTAAQILLRKVLPDLSSTDIGTADGTPLAVSIIRFNDLEDKDKPDER